MVEMSVAGIALDAASRTPMVLLRDPSGRRQVPIWIDQAQAHNIMAGLQGGEPPRPLSHDLMAALLVAGGLELERVIVHAIEDSTFHAVLKLRPDLDEAELAENEVLARGSPHHHGPLCVPTWCGAGFPHSHRRGNHPRSALLP